LYAHLSISLVCLFAHQWLWSFVYQLFCLFIVHPSVCPSICLRFSLSIHVILSISLSVHWLAISPFTCQSIRPSVCSFVHLPVCRSSSCLSVRLSTSQPVCLLSFCTHNLNKFHFIFFLFKVESFFLIRNRGSILKTTYDHLTNQNVTWRTNRNTTSLNIIITIMITRPKLITLVRNFVNLLQGPVL
jgi:hypothetical protein